MSRCSSRRCLPALLTSLLLLVPLGARAADFQRALGRREWVFRALPSDSLLRLPDRIPLQSSDSVWIQGVFVTRDLDYRMLGEPARLLWLRRPPDSAEVRIHYRFLAVPLADLYQHPSVWSPGTSSDPAAAGAVPTTSGLPARPSESAGAFGRFNISGSKTLSFEVASQRDLAVKQSLDLSLGGEIGGDVSVVAILSDRNLPLTPEGQTQELSSLDKVVVEVKSPGYGASLGDFDLKVEGGEYVSLTRTVQGVRGRASGGGTEVEGAAALSKGEFISRQFLGEEGRQGPYNLTDRAGLAGVPVVAGSEQVWLDGERMQRGDNSDYTVDYGNGSITFTARRPIHPGSRIAVDYQFAEDAFRRSVVLGRATRRWGSRGGVKFSWLRESDDPSRPVGANLTAEDLDSLKAAPAGSVVTTSGAHFVGAGKGDYWKLAAATSEEHFQYAGRDSGDYQVDFMLAKSSDGSYADSVASGGLAFAFRGLGRGAYKPGRSLPVPGSQGILDWGGDLNVGTLRLAGEGALSLVKGNVLRAAGADAASAWNLSTVWSPELRLGGNPRGKLEFELRGRRQEDLFQSPGRVLAPFAEEDWNLAAADRERGRTVWTGATRYRPDEKSQLGVELGTWNSSSGRDARRAHWFAERQGEISLRSNWYDISNRDSVGRESGSRGRGNVGAGLALGAFRPEVHWDHDAARDSSGAAVQGFDDYGLGTKWSSASGFSAEGFQSWRRDFGPAIAPPGAPLRGLTQRIGLNYAASAGWSVSGTLAQRTTQGSSDSLGAARNAQLQALFHRGAADGEAHYEIGATRFQGNRRQISFVGTGLGAYDSLGNYVGKGDYTVHTFSGADLGLTTQLSFNGRLELSGERSGREDLLRHFLSRTETQLVRSARRTRGNDLFPGPGSVVGDTGVLLGNAVFRQDVEWSQGEGHASVRLRHEWVGDADRQSPVSVQVGHTRSESLRLRALGGGGASLELQALVKRREVDQGPAASPVAYVTRGFDANATAKWAPSPTFSLALSGRVLVESSERGAGDSHQVEFGPSASITRGGRFRLEARLNRIAVSETGSIQPGFSNYGSLLRSRLEHDFNLTYQVKSSLQASVLAHGVRPDAGSLSENARFEMRATF